MKKPLSKIKIKSYLIKLHAMKQSAIEKKKHICDQINGIVTEDSHVNTRNSEMLDIMIVMMMTCKNQRI